MSSAQTRFNIAKMVLDVSTYLPAWGRCPKVRETARQREVNVFQQQPLVGGAFNRIAGVMSATFEGYTIALTEST